MANPRIPYSINKASFRFEVDGSEFKFNPDDPASRQAAFDAMQLHGNTVIDVLDRRAGRRLTHRELIRGVAHPETRSQEELFNKRQAERAKRAEEPQKAINPAHITAAEREKGKRETNKEALKRWADEWDVQQDIEAKQQALESDPQRNKAIEHAANSLRSVRLDPSTTVEEIEQAEARLALARTGDLKQYATEDRAWRKVQADKVAASAKPIDEQIAALRQQKQDILAGSFEQLPAPVIVESESTVPPILSDLAASFAADRERQ